MDDDFLYNDMAEEAGLANKKVYLKRGRGNLA
jgi:hypothetical protein